MNGIAHPRIMQRYGVKGPAAEAWLHARGIAVPGAANRIAAWNAAAGGSAGRCLRLGFTEFLVEHDGEEATTAPSLPACGDTPGGYLLLREDFSLVLDGPAWPAALAQLCSFDLARLRDEPELVVMTLLAGIAITLVREPTADPDRLALRLWCDASYAHYLQEALHAVLPDLTHVPGGPR